MSNITDKDIESLQSVVESISNISSILANQNTTLEILSSEINQLKIRLKDSPYLAKVAGGIDEEIERLKRAKEFAGETP
jgi:archaellum component FlaC